MIRRPAGLPDGLARLERTVVFGVLNVTPDSFSDGGSYPDVAAAVAAGARMHADGADVVDVGGESTRPGAARVDGPTERSRILPVVAGLADAGVPVSIDTMRADVAADAVAAGAVIVNDVSGGLADQDMLPMVASLGVPYILMHWRGHGWYMDSKSVYTDVVADVAAELAARLAACAEARLDLTRVVLDPGLGFAKLPEHNWALLRGLPALAGLGNPILVGASRKRFLGALLEDQSGPRPIGGREAATTALSALAAAAGVWAVRVHSVRDSADAVRVAARWTAGADE